MTPRREPLAEMRAYLYPFATAPFPYDGTIPTTGDPFLDVTTPDGRRGHTSPRGGVYYQDPTYSDDRVLVALPAGFDIAKPGAIVVFFHGNQTILERDVVGHEHLLEQVQNSTMNAALLAPQFAVDALDSSAGKFWQPWAFLGFMAEAARVLSVVWDDPASRRVFSRMPIILIAYSGGYNPAIYAATLGGVGQRPIGMVMLDALYGEEDRFVDWVRDHKRAFFLSTYTAPAEASNEEVRQRLEARHIRCETRMPELLTPGEVAFVPTPGLDHAEYMTRAWVKDPVTWILDRVPGFER
ncbi:hypothetical protein [Solirhodobacter olei]|uniref:hypothetical protein n=1 Tax=Solirhodobacter olei TaxID=2493082 RepID=UPI000FD8E4FB|nr:hypothetical protein [Solirhodobacter olei]